MKTIESARTTMKKPVSSAICTLLLMLSTVAGAAAQTVLAQIPIPSSSGGGKVATNPALNLVYTASGLLSGGTLTVIDGRTLTVVTTISNSNNSLQGVSVDLKNGNFWTANLYGGQVLTYSSANTQIFANTVGFCPIETTFDCELRRVWVGAQCGGGNDPVFAFNADTFALIAGPIGTGGVMNVTIANPATGKLYVTASGVSKEVNPTTFAVTATGFGLVLAVDSVTNILFAAQGSDLQIVNGANDTVVKTVTLGYTPGDMGVNSALGRVYLVNPLANAIEARSEQGALLGTFSLGAGNQPVQIAADSIRGRIYVKVVDGSGFWSVWAIEDLVSTPTTLLNISTRLNVQTDDDVLIGGFIITGTQPKNLIVRAIGPSLGALGVTGFLVDPTLELHEPDGTIVSNDNWKDTQEAEIIASTLPPTNDFESAIVATLDPGAYTAIVSGRDKGTGIGLVEAYDLDQTVDSQLANIGTRGLVETGDEVMIGGFIVGGGNPTVVLRAIGPSLAGAAVANPLADPFLELYNSNGDIINSNDNWMDSPDKQTIIDDDLAPANDQESALLSVLAPGAYTAIVRGVNNGTGVGLVEAYNLQ